MLAPKGDLAAVEIAFFAPALLIGLYIVFRHGFNRQAGWVYIVVLSLLRIIGGAATLYMDVNNDFSTSLIETAVITSSIGTAPLLLALMGFLARINAGMERKSLPQLAFRPIQLAALAALIIAIIGGVNESSTSPTDQQTGKSLEEAASIVFALIWLVLALITIWNALNSRYVLSNEKMLLGASVIAVPFLLVRVAYTVSVAFSGPTSEFYYRNVNVYIEAFMQFTMEAIVVCLYIFAGLMTPKADKREIRAGNSDVEGQKYEMPQQGSGRTAPRYEQRAPRQQQQRGIGDYRPSRLIMNAIRARQ